jgi:hypothetical protein
MNRVLKNVELKWCKFGAVDAYGKYGCQLVLTKDHAKTLKSWGINGVKKDDDGSLFIRVRRDSDKGPVPVVDASLTPVTATISNGATANVMLDVYEYKKYGGGITCRLEKVQLLKWEPYQQGEEFEPVDGEEFESEDEGGKLF